MFKQLLSVFLESRCPLCDRTTSKTICIYCQKKLYSYQLEKGDRPSWRGDLPVFAWGRYDGQLKSAIAKLKYENQPEIGRILGGWLGQTWKQNNLISRQKITVIPIPLHPEKLKTRGYNQAAIIAQGFCQETGYYLQPKSLTRVRNTEAMFGLNPLERVANLKNAFAMGDRLPEHPVLLLDDIYTAGTTVKEASKILRQNRVNVIGVVVIAKTTKLGN